MEFSSPASISCYIVLVIAIFFSCPNRIGLNDFLTFISIQYFDVNFQIKHLGKAMSKILYFQCNSYLHACPSSCCTKTVSQLMRSWYMYASARS